MCDNDAYQITDLCCNIFVHSTLQFTARSHDFTWGGAKGGTETDRRRCEIQAPKAVGIGEGISPSPTD